MSQNYFSIFRQIQLLKRLPKLNINSINLDIRLFINNRFTQIKLTSISL
jgi:hypothetical protein